MPIVGARSASSAKSDSGMSVASSCEYCADTYGCGCSRGSCSFLALRVAASDFGRLRLALEGGRGVMRDYVYVDGAKVLPPDAEVRKLRPAD